MYHEQPGMNVQTIMIFDTIPGSHSRAKISQMLENLSRIALFEGFSSWQLELLTPLFEVYSCPPETVIFQQGDEAVFLYLILDGFALIQYKPYDSPPITLTRLKSGDAFGWSAAVGSPEYNSSAVSAGELETIRIRGTDLANLCREHPATGTAILDRLAHGVSGRWQNAHLQVEAMLKKSLEHAAGNHAAPIPKGNKMASPIETREQQLRALLEKIDAYVEQFHGGNVDFVDFDGQVLKVRLGGACIGCPLSPATLHGWVAGTVHQFFPDVEVLEVK